MTAMSLPGPLTSTTGANRALRNEVLRMKVSVPVVPEIRDLICFTLGPVAVWATELV